MGWLLQRQRHRHGHHPLGKASLPSDSGNELVSVPPVFPCIVALRVGGTGGGSLRRSFEKSGRQVARLERALQLVDLVQRRRVHNRRLHTRHLVSLHRKPKFPFHRG